MTDQKDLNLFHLHDVNLPWEHLVFYSAFCYGAFCPLNKSHVHGDRFLLSRLKITARKKEIMKAETTNFMSEIRRINSNYSYTFLVHINFQEI